MAGTVTIIHPHQLQSPPKFYAVKNWRQYQHYTKRNPSWVKLHCKVMRTSTWLNSDEPTRLLMIVVILVAAENFGVIPNDPPLLKKLGNFRKTPSLKPLIEADFLVEVLAGASTTLDRERGRDRSTEGKERDSQQVEDLVSGRAVSWN